MSVDVVRLTSVTKEPSTPSVGDLFYSKKDKLVYTCVDISGEKPIWANPQELAPALYVFGKSIYLMVNGALEKVNTVIPEGILDAYVLPTIVPTVSVGGIQVGERLERMSISSLFEMLLTPEVAPLIEEPSVSIKVSRLLVEESSLSEIGVLCTFNRGRIELHKNKDPRAGEAIVYRFKSNSYPVVEQETPLKRYINLPLGITQFSVEVSYGEGPQPKSTKGNKVAEKCPAGVLTTQVVSVECVNRWYLISTAGDPTPLPLIRKGESRVVVIPKNTKYLQIPTSWGNPKSIIQSLKNSAVEWARDEAGNFEKATVTEGELFGKSYRCMTFKDTSAALVLQIKC